MARSGAFGQGNAQPESSPYDYNDGFFVQVGLRIFDGDSLARVPPSL